MLGRPLHYTYIVTYYMHQVLIYYHITLVGASSIMITQAPTQVKSRTKNAEYLRWFYIFPVFKLLIYSKVTKKPKYKYIDCYVYLKNFKMFHDRYSVCIYTDY